MLGVVRGCRGASCTQEIFPLERGGVGDFPLQFLKGRMMMAGGSVLVVGEGLPVERENLLWKEGKVFLQLVQS